MLNLAYVVEGRGEVGKETGPAFPDCGNFTSHCEWPGQKKDEEAPRSTCMPEA